MAPQNAATDSNMRQNRPLGAKWKATLYQEACEQKSRTNTESRPRNRIRNRGIEKSGRFGASRTNVSRGGRRTVLAGTVTLQTGAGIAPHDHDGGHYSHAH